MNDSSRNPLTPFLERQGVVILDGGLATELERRGFDLDDELWSARLLVEQPDAIRRLHLDYLEAGADCIVTASYQASFEGFARAGCSRSEAVDLLRRSATLALEAREQFWSATGPRRGRLRPLVAASVGPYGAYLADGSEYRGDYGLDVDALLDFHRDRWEVLAASGVDLLACETLPCRSEARALARLLRDTAGVSAWFSFSCRDGAHVSDGSELAEVVSEIGAFPRAVAVGINCTPPRLVPDLIRRARRATGKPIAVYPNSGESWDARRKQWRAAPETVAFSELCQDWHELGARLVGGCCRTGPDEIRGIRARLVG